MWVIFTTTATTLASLYAPLHLHYCEQLNHNSHLLPLLAAYEPYIARLPFSEREN